MKEFNKIEFKVKLAVRKILYILFFLIDKYLLRKTSDIFILCYHGISNDQWRYSVNFEIFVQQMNYLLANFSPISISDIELFIEGKKRIEKTSFAITIDDGYKDVMRLRELFKKLNIKPAIFVLSNTQNANRKEMDTNRAFLSKEELLELNKDGWIIGNHGATHADFYKLTDRQIKEEVVNPKKDLEKNLGIKLNYFAYPKGRYTEKILKAVVKAGYRMALTMDDALINRNTDLLRIPRIGVDRTHSFAEFKTLFSPLNIKFRSLIKSLNYGK